jgi:IclR family transcriptional regulator, acetate operon repressor
VASGDRGDVAEPEEAVTGTDSDESRPATDGPYSVRAVVRALDVLDLLRQSSVPLSLGEAADAVGLPKSSVLRYLSTLEARGYVERDLESGGYRVGLALASQQLENLSSRARPVLTELRDRFGETMNLGVLSGGQVAYLEIVESPKAIRFAARKGSRDPLHSTALGKALASYLGDDEIREILAAQGMPARTSRTITDAEQFLAAVASVRQSGYALDDRENEEDGRCVAVPVLETPVPAAISLSAPVSRFSLNDVDEVATALHVAARKVAG